MKNILLLVLFFFTPLFGREYDNRYKDYFLEAVLNNNIYDVSKYISKVDINTMYEDNETALSLAASYGYFDIVKTLIEAGADVNIQNRYGNTALMLAASYGFDNVAKILIESGAKIDVQNVYGNTALILAS